MSEMKVRMILEAIDRATAPLRRISGAMGKVAHKGHVAPLGEIGRRLGAIGRTGAKASLALGGLAGRRDRFA